MNDNDNIKELFRSKLNDFEAEIPQNGWKELEKALSSSTKKRALPTYWYAAAAAAVVLILVGIFVLQSPERSLPVQTTHEFTMQPESGTSEKDYSKDVVPSSKSNTLVAQQRVAEIAKKEHAISRKKNRNVVKKRIASASTMIDTETEATQENVIRSFENKRKPSKKTIDENQKQQLIQDFIDAGKRAGLYADDDILPNERKNLTLAMHSSSGLTSFSKTTNQPISLRSSKSESLMSNATGSEEDRVMFLYDNLYEPSKVELEHDQPISIGFMLSRKISDRVSIETGLTYTHLSSKSKSDSPTNDKHERQHIYYLSVPVNVNYELASLNKLDVYVSLGGSIQKDVYGKFSYKEQSIDAETESFSEETVELNIKQKNPQLSLNAGLGISYPIYQDLKLYGKLGGAYYFDAKNEYNTIYSDQKFALDVNVGLKIDL